MLYDAGSPNLVLPDNLEGWDGVGGGGGWFKTVDVWHKPTQYYKVIIFQLKIKH